MGDADEDTQTMECVLRAETELGTCPEFLLIPEEAVPESGAELAMGAPPALIPASTAPTGCLSWSLLQSCDLH